GGAPTRPPATGAGSSGANSSPAITASARAQSATVRAIGPIESSANDSGNAPSVGTRHWLGLKPPKPHHAPRARLKPNKAAHRARNAGRPAGVGADGDLAHLVGGGDCGTRRRAARDA